jgi:hypothetical protein
MKELSAPTNAVASGDRSSTLLVAATIRAAKSLLFLIVPLAAP